MPLDLYGAQTLIMVVSGLGQPGGFLLNKFFPRVQDPVAEEIYFDVTNETTQLAPFVSPMVGGQVMRQDGYVTKSLKPAYVKPKNVIDPRQSFRRLPGEKIGGALSAQDRAAATLRNLLEKQLGMITAREEWMAAKALAAGKYTVEGEKYPAKEVDFQRPAGHTVALTTTARWGETGVSPLANLETWANTVFSASGAWPSQVIMTPEAWALFRQDAALKDRLDVRRVLQGDVNVGVSDTRGGKYMGTVDTFDIHVYQDWYDTDSGPERFLPAYTVLMVSDQYLEGTRAYGAIMDQVAIEAGLADGPMAVRYFPRSWMENDPSVRMLMTQSAPLVFPGRPSASFAAIVR